MVPDGRVVDEKSKSPPATIASAGRGGEGRPLDLFPHQSGLRQELPCSLALPAS